MTLFLFGLAWLGGIAIGQATPLPTLEWLALTAIALAATIAFRRHRIYRSLFTFLLIVFLGAARLQGSQLTIDPDHVATHNDTGRKVTITGVVVGPPDMRDAYTGLPGSPPNSERLWVIVMIDDGRPDTGYN